jgi:hypothetical protein
MQWYQKKRQKAIALYQAGYYPRHRRTPNLMVCALYELGYLVADFGPMIINLFDTIYTNIRKLFAFIVGLLIELSTVIVLLGTIAFSVVHSIGLLRLAGATGGMEYVGVLMFEVVFISSTAALTGSLMKRQKPNWFSIAGFIVGILFVWCSNVTMMKHNWIGIIIGCSTPILLIICEGILAYRYINELAEQDETQLLEILRRNRLTAIDLRRAIQLYLNHTKTNPPMVQDGQVKEVESVPDQVQNEPSPVAQDGTEKNAESIPEVVEHESDPVTSNETQSSDEENHPVAQEPNHTEPETVPVDGTETEPMDGAEPEPETVPHEVEKTVENTEEYADAFVPKTDENKAVLESKEEAENETDKSSEPNHTTVPKTDTDLPEPEPSMVEEPNHTPVQKEAEMDAETVPHDEEKPNHAPVQNPTTEPQVGKKSTSKSTKKLTTRGSKKKKIDDPELKKVIRDAKRWGEKYYEQNGKPPGRVVCGKRYNLNQRQARDLAEFIKEELGLTKAS